MRSLVPAAGVLFLATAALGCSGATTAPVATVASPSTADTLGAVALHNAIAESTLAIYELAIDPATLQATSTLKASRRSQANDDLYLLSIDNFLNARSFRVTTVSSTADSLEVGYLVTHPFPAPNNPAGTPNGSTNRADLGIVGRILILADVLSPTGNTFFADRIANTALVKNADAYYAPAGLLNLSGFTANTFPYMQLVDESGSDGSRPGISNGGDPTGNFGNDGWTRAEFGANNDAWTGFGVLHQGQRSTGTISFAKSELAAGLTLDVAIIAKYNDPRGGQTSAQKRGNRLPPASPDATLFAYRMPHGALDVAAIEFLGESGGYTPNVISASTLDFRVVDWDARAIETAAGDLAADLDVTTVEVGEAGPPELAVCIPGVLGGTTYVDTFLSSDLLDDDSAYGGDAGSDSGRPGDALFYSRAVTKVAGSGQTDGDYVGLVRARDVESASPLPVALDGSTLTPLSTNLPSPETFQAFTVAMTTTGGGGCPAYAAAQGTPVTGGWSGFSAQSTISTCRTGTLWGCADYAAFPASSPFAGQYLYVDTRSAYSYMLYREVAGATDCSSRVALLLTDMPTYQGTQLEIDSTGRILFAEKVAPDDNHQVNSPYTEDPAQPRFMWFDYTGTPVSSVNTVTTPSGVVAMALDQDDNVYVIGVDHILRRYLRASGYAEDTGTPYPINLNVFGLTYLGGVSGPNDHNIGDFVIDYTSGAFFIASATRQATNNCNLWRIECDGTYDATVNGNPNPRIFTGATSATQQFPIDVVIDQFNASGTLLPQGQHQILFGVDPGTTLAGYPEVLFFNSDLNNYGSWDPVNPGQTVNYTSLAYMTILPNNTLVGKNNNDYLNHSYSSVPPAGWQ